MSLSSIYPQSAFRPQSMGYQPQPIPGMSLQMPLGVIPQQAQHNTGLIGLHGLDSAKQYPMSPNTTVPTFDLDSDHGFILDADANGVVSIKIISFHVVTEEEYRKATEAEKPIQLTKSEYEELVKRVNTLEEELKNAKQPVRTKPDSANANAAASRGPAKYSGKPAASVDDSAV